MEPPSDSKDFISQLPDDCLSLILQRVRKRDLKQCNLVCRKWFFLQGQSRQRLTLSAACINTSSIPVLFTRYESVTKLVLQGGFHAKDFKFKLSDEELELISISCSNLTTLKLIYLYVTDVGMAALGTNARRLKKLSCRWKIQAKALNALLSCSSSLEAISLYNLSAAMAVYPGAAASSLKSISLRYITDNPEWFEPLIVGSKNLTSLKICSCRGDWSDVLKMVDRRDNRLFEVYLSNLQVISDIALKALSNFSKLEILHVADSHPQSLNDEALISISTGCFNLKTIKLAGECRLVTHVGMAALGMSAKRLKKFCCRKCKFGTKGLNALTSNSSSLQMISIKNLRFDSTELINPCAVGSSLISIRLKNLYGNQWPQCFAPLITGSKNLTSLRVLNCFGNWNDVFSRLAMGENSLCEVYLNEVKVTDGQVR